MEEEVAEKDEEVKKTEEALAANESALADHELTLKAASNAVDNSIKEVGEEIGVTPENLKDLEA